MNAHVNWTHEETQALLAVWSEEKIQCGLGESVRNEKVYGEVSRRLTVMGMFRSAKQCRDKIKKLKLEYRRIKKHGHGRGDNFKSFRWYDTLDSILSEGPAMREDMDRSPTMIQKFIISDVETNAATLTEIPDSFSSTFINSHQAAPPSYPAENKQEQGFYPRQVEDFDGPSTSTAVSPPAPTAMQTSVRDTRWCSWSKREVQALLTLWANPAVQEELLLNVRNNQVYARLSAALESLGFSKTPQKCREKIKKLKQDYKRLKNDQHGVGKQRTRTTVWFSIMDDVLSSRAAAGRYSETTEPSASQPESTVDVDHNDETRWLADEVQVLLTLWSQPHIQKQLLNTATKTQVFKYLSSELALVGFNKTPQQCSLKVTNLKEEYKKIKETEPNGSVNSNWFAILDSVLGPGEAASLQVDSSAAVIQVKSADDENEKGILMTVWTSEEVEVLLNRWAEDDVQEQLRSAPTNERVFAQLSSDLATQGFDKTTSQCRSKIRLLTDKYRMIKKQKDFIKPTGRWFTIMDKVLGREKSEDVTKKRAAEVRNTHTESVQRSQLKLSDTVEDLGCSLSISSLCLLVPTLRLMCAFMWHVVQTCNVMHYGKVEELVRVVTELAPELLTSREKAQILLRLRARMVLELCRSESTANPLTVKPHLSVIESLSSSTCDQEELEELENSKSNFVAVVQRLLEDTEERTVFFKDIFPLHYGQQYQATLKALLWKFITRLDYLLPVPDIKQTAEWLSTAPSVVEKCGQMFLERDQLKELLSFHQQQAGITDKSYSQTQNMFLPRLSLPPKPKRELCSEQQESAAGEKEEEQFYSSEDEEPAEGRLHEVAQILKDCSKEDERLNEQVKELISEKCTNFNIQTLLRLQTCSLCSYSDSKVAGLLQHIREVHLPQESSQLQPNEWKKPKVAQRAETKVYITDIKGSANICEYCGKVFKYVSTLKSHTKTHTLPFHCDTCDKKYASMASLHVHRRNHTGETPYLCSHCGRGFRTSHSLSSHVHIHTGERRYKCHICGKTSIQHLARHMRMHRGEKNFLCTECGKTFLSSGELRLHTRYHTGERPYTCKYCGKGFVAKCFLTVHLRRHTGENPYKCSVCPKAFHTLRAQRKHIKIHSTSKSFQCLKCGKIFRQEDTFRLHLQTHE
ncbi:uncharacterized protein LOC122870995 isoform X2 [Xyrichtys novacula]|uniref:Uncharacterized protein LOC122870995 isoform X2 n=1 Tax=Xyrichtys novacula TaxID=13765 RepID=A0AAV1F2B9_XYRNO|nr:uncharacterized protein LOC122870995 isoform X2 [Xyrichtys novacula]